MTRITIYILLFFLGINLNINSQTWHQLETEYNILRKNNQKDLAINKAKEIYNWVNNNEGDTTLRLPISLKLIGNSYREINIDSSLFYYDKSLDALRKQNRTTHIQYAKLLYNKSNIYYSKNDSLSLEYALNSILVLEKLKFTEYPFNTWLYLRGSILHHSFGNYIESKKLSIQYLKIKRENNDTVSEEYFQEKMTYGSCCYSLDDFDLAESIFKNCLSEIKKSLGVKNEEYLRCLSYLKIIEISRKNYALAIKYNELELENIKLNYGFENEKYIESLKSIGFYYKLLNVLDSSIHYYNKAIKLSSCLNNNNYASVDLWDKLGDVYQLKGEYNIAKSFYEKALAERLIIQDSSQLAANYLDIGYCYTNLKMNNNSLEWFLNSKKICENLKIYDEVYVCNLELISECYFKELNYNEAMKYAKLYKEFLVKKYGDNVLEYKYIISYIGMIYDFMDDYHNAELNFQEFEKEIKNDSYDIYEKYPAIKINMGYHNFIKGNYKTAEKLYLEALDLNLKTTEKIQGYNNLAVLYLEIGLNEKSSDYLQKNINLIDTSSNFFNRNYAASLHNLGLANSSSGLKYFLKEKLYLEKYDKITTTNYSKILITIGSYYMDQNNLSESEKYYTIALRSFYDRNDTISVDFGLLLFNIGVLYNLKYDLVLSKSYYKKSLLNIESNIGVSHPLYLKIQNRLAWLNYYSNDSENAFLDYKKLLGDKQKNVNESFTWLSDQEKEEFWNGEINFFNQINLIAIKDSLNVAWDYLALKSSLFSKGILLDNNTILKKIVSKSNDPSIKYLYKEFELLKKNHSLQLTGNFSNAFNLKLTTNKIDSVQKLIITKIDLDIHDNKIFDNNDLKNNLKEGEIAVEFNRYFNYFDTTYYYSAFIIDRNFINPKLIKICTESELNSLNLETELNSLYDLVWKPLLPSLTNVNTIYYSPSGLLNNIPFQALYKEENGQREYVMDKFIMHQLTSTRYLALGLKQKEQEPIESTIALFGGINYNDYPNALADTTNHNESSEAAFLYKNAIVLNRELDSTRAGAIYLPGTKKEVEAIANVLNAKRWQVDVSEGKNASENKIKSLSGNNSKAILHIATHGFAFPDKEEKIKGRELRMMNGNDKYKASDNPMIRSGLLFSGANMTWQGKGDSLINTTNEDGVLTAYELSQLDFSNTKLAVLSACETGKGEIQGSEGTFGLKRALKLAGVDNMIVSLWKVPDDATMEMMTLFYTELANTRKPVSSFETAQKIMRIKYPNEPKKWAGFVFVR